AIVTGSTSGIGFAIAQMLSQYGAKVVINSISSIDKGRDIARQFPDNLYCQADISNEKDCKNLIETTIQQYGRLDFLINNAGVIGRLPSNDIETITNELFTNT